MSAEAGWIAAATLAATSALLAVAWNGYRSAAFLLLLDTLPLCG